VDPEHPDGQLLVRARTVWVPLDAATARPRRIDARLTGCFAAAQPRPGES